MNQILNTEEWKKLAREKLAPNVTYIDPKFKEVASWAEELLNAFWVEQQKDLDAFIDTIHQQLQKAREEEREKIFGDIEQFKTEVATMEYCDDFKDGIYATIEHILAMPVFESVLDHSELDQDKK